tara:strand:+ start:10317 stop:10715 length:399 start_codon:yes stop_codon:yes gene_type:complete
MPGINFHDLAKKANSGDKEALSILVIEAPPGMMSDMSPEDFAKMISEDKSMAEKMGGMDHFSKDSYDAYADKKDESHSEKKYPDDHHEAMKQMAEELYKASKLHAGQADKLMEICEELYGDSKSEKSEGSDY